jgi:hypothetical protein
VLQGTLSDGVAWITLARWAPPSSAFGLLACLGTHVKRPQTHLNEDSVACIHFLYAWEVTGLSCNGAVTLALWTCLLLASQHGPPS